MKYSIVIPAHNEEGSIAETVTTLADRLGQEQIDYEIVVVDDHCTDRTADVVSGLEGDPGRRRPRHRRRRRLLPAAGSRL